MKKGKRRFFVLKNDVLMWFTEEPKSESELAASCVGNVPLAHCMCIMVTSLLNPRAQRKPAANAVAKIAACFMLNTPLGRSYTLSAESTEEAESWQSSITTAIRTANSVSHPAAALFTPLAAAASAAVLCSGPLTYASSKKKQFHYVLTASDSCLRWYDAENDAQAAVEATNKRSGTAAAAAANAAGALALAGCSVRLDGSLGVAIYTPEGDAHLFEAASAEERTNWHDALQAAAASATHAARSALAAREADATASLSGWLRRGRHKYWVVLRHNSLQLHSGEEGKERGAKLKGGVELGGCHIESVSSPAHSFAVDTPMGGRELFTARTQRDQVEWVRAVQTVIEACARAHAADYALAEQHATALLDIVFGRQGAYGVLRNLLQAYSAEEVVKAASQLCFEQKCHLGVVDVLLRTELESSVSVGTLFRGDSAATKFTREFLRYAGSEFLQAAIGSHVRQLIANPAHHEVDPSKIKPGESVADNLNTLEATVTAVLQSVFAAEEFLTRDMYGFFANVNVAVDDLFPGQYAKVAAGFLFLRFVCPAIFSPAFFGIVEKPPTGEAQRALVLVAKVLQNLANDVEFGKKEAFLTPMNTFIQRNRANLQEFFVRLCIMPPGARAVAARRTTAKDRATWMTTVTRNLTANFELVQRETEKETDQYFVVLGELLRFAAHCRRH